MMRRILMCGAVGLVLGAFTTDPAAAACAGGSGSERQDRFELAAASDVIFEGTALAGPRLDNGLLTSPATFRVDRTVKGRLPGRVKVTTADRRTPEGASSSGEGISVSAGEHWTIFAERHSGQVLLTSVCSGSRKSPEVKPPAIRVDGRSVTLRAVRWNGVPEHGRVLPHVRARGATTVTSHMHGDLRLGRGGELMRATQTSPKASWSIDHVRAGDRIVLATAGGFWAAEVR